MAQVAEIWRYPVKSMAGERLESVHVGQGGLDGDRRYAFVDSLPSRVGKRLTARQVDRLLLYRGRLHPAGVEVETPTGDRWPVGSAGVRAEIEAAAGRRLELADHPGGNFDDAPVLVVNLATVQALEVSLGLPVDRRRFRANLYVQGIAADDESAWLGRGLLAGSAVLRPVSWCERCVLTTYDPDTLEREPSVLQALTETRQGRLGLYCEVLETGSVTVGDDVELL